MTTFFVEGLKHVFQIGTVVPSSRWLARAMTRSLRRRGSPKRVLEVGPGTGAITRVILSSLNQGDELHLVEINPAFCRQIEKKLLRRYRRETPGVQVELRCESIMSVPFDGTFDIVISSLPFFAFAPSTVRAILGKLTGLLAEDGELTYMHYAGVRHLKAPFVRRPRRRELSRIEAICRSRRRRDGASCEFVLLNILPSLVVSSKKNGNGKSPGLISRGHGTESE